MPKGVFSLTPADHAIPSAGVLDNANVDGVSIRTHWDALETSDGIYNWAYLDAQVNRATAAGKIVSLRVGTGSGGATASQGNVPDWVMALVTTTFQFIDTNSGGITRTIPAFWDTAFVLKKREMLTALGVHFSGNTSIKIVYVGFANAQSTDWGVPDSTTVDSLGASERQRWLDIGYTAQKVIDAGCPATGTNGIIDAAAFAFPNAIICYSAGLTSGHSGSPSMLGLDPDKNYAARTVLTNAIAKYGNRIMIQKDSLSAKTASYAPYSGQPASNDAWTIIYDYPTRVGAQMVWSAYPDTTRMGGAPGLDPATVLTSAVNCGVDYHTKYQEIYETDVINLPAVISYAHRSLSY
jgi:hypothetical protein